jgi:hypothetical protein
MNIKPIAATLLAASSLAFAATPALADSNVILFASLDGPSVPNGGDPAASGTFTASVGDGASRICYRLETQSLDNQTIAHIHEGASGEPGRPLINLQIGANSCTSVSGSTMSAILNDPAAFYVDVLSSDFPEGAVRGQLALGDSSSTFSYNGN